MPYVAQPTKSAIVLRAGKRLKHVHMSTPERTIPVGPEGADYETFFANLHRIGFRPIVVSKGVFGF